MCDRSDCTAKYFLAKGCSAEMVGLLNPITVDQQCYVSCMTKVTINILIRLKLKKEHAEGSMELNSMTNLSLIYPSAALSQTTQMDINSGMVTQSSI